MTLSMPRTPAPSSLSLTEVWKPTKPADPVTSTVIPPSFRGVHDFCTDVHLMSLAGAKVETAASEPLRVLMVA